MIKDILATIKRYIHRAIAYLVAFFLRSGATFDPENFRLWERRGYHITPLHFYYPIPDTREIDRMEFQQSELPGIDLRPAFQLKLLSKAFTKFSEEYNRLPIKPTKPDTFYLDNETFGGIDPFIYYCMIRHFKPRTIVEVGSGYSTLLGAQASGLNGSTRYICVDPWPRDFISRCVPNIELICQKVEDLDIHFFQQLQPNDVLFIDSSHVIRTAGDVCFNILEVLPRLARGVLVHFHDVFLPYEYPKVLLVEQHYFWTEQYLLQAYLADNQHTEVLFASKFMSDLHQDEVRRAFPQASWIGGASFWIRKI